MHSLSPTTTGVKVNQSSWNLAQRYSLFISSNRVRYRRKSVYYDQRYLRLNVSFNIFESCFLREYFIYQLQILTTYYTHRWLYLVKISSDYLYLFSRRKIFLKISGFSFSDDNRIKSQAIVLKFGRQVDFLYLRTEFVPGKNRFITTKDFWG